MFNMKNYALNTLVHIGPRYLPFADVATQDVPLSRLLRLSLFQVSVGMALVLLVGTLNRVMIVELNVPATLVAVMISLPLVFAPFRTLIGFKSDTHKSAFGWRRVPYIWKGTMLQFGGFAVMPFALLVLSGYGESHDTPLWIGHGAAAIAFLLVGAGVHTVQTVGLALATDLVKQEDQPNVVGLMYVMLLLGMIGSALIFGWLLTDYTPGKLIQVLQGAAVVTIILNVVALWKQEGRDRARAASTEPAPNFWDEWSKLISGAGATRLLIVIALGTMGFGMADVLLEPYGGHVLGLTVAETTRLTAVLALGGLAGFALASRVLSQGMDPVHVSFLGGMIGVPGFGAIVVAATGDAHALFITGVLAIGFGAGLFSHGTLTATMRRAPKEQIGLALGTWGAVQATAAGVAIAIGGGLRDAVLMAPGGGNAATPYITVFGMEMALLCVALVAIIPLLAPRRRIETVERLREMKERPLEEA
ncbi:MAG: PucC family protein [Pseudomonadota bacterium]